MSARIELTREEIVDALVYCHCRRGAAARRLDIAVATLRRRCQQDLKIVPEATSRMDPDHADAASLHHRLSRTPFGGVFKKEAYGMFYEDQDPVRLNAKRVDTLLRQFRKYGRKQITMSLAELYATLDPPFAATGE